MDAFYGLSQEAYEASYQRGRAAGLYARLHQEVYDCSVAALRELDEQRKMLVAGVAQGKARNAPHAAYLDGYLSVFAGEY